MQNIEAKVALAEPGAKRSIFPSAVSCRAISEIAIALRAREAVVGGVPILEISISIFDWYGWSRSHLNLAKGDDLSNNAAPDWVSRKAVD